MLRLRSYQEEAIQKIKETLEETDRTYIDIPTGGGKTKIFLSYARQYHKKILVVVPSIQLMEQVHGSALNYYHKSEISKKGGTFKQKPKDLHICVVNSLSDHYMDTMFWEANFDLIIIDEAHHSFGKSYKRLIEFSDSYFNCDYLGVTATPDRTDGQMLCDILGSCSYKISIEDLILQGFLCDIEGYSVKTDIDISEVNDRNGDFSLNQLFKKLCTKNRNELVLNIYKKEFKDKKTIVFCINIEHSKQINSLLNTNGISSAHIDGNMDTKERESILSAFRNNEIQVICNCQLLTEGFDEPSIDGIILARPTRSRTLFCQMIGRGLRIFGGKKNCKIIDIVDNHKFLASFNDLISSNERVFAISEFKSIRGIREHLGREMIKITEFSIERVNLLSNPEKLIDSKHATDSMEDYLNKNKIKYFHPLSFEEGSFMIWFDKLQKEYKNGNN